MTRHDMPHDHEDEDMKAAREEIENMSFEEYLSLPVYES